MILAILVQAHSTDGTWTKNFLKAFISSGPIIAMAFEGCDARHGRIPTAAGRGGNRKFE
jgi:hypothetical protein